MLELNGNFLRQYSFSSVHLQMQFHETLASISCVYAEGHKFKLLYCMITLCNVIYEISNAMPHTVESLTKGSLVHLGATGALWRITTLQSFQKH